MALLLDDRLSEAGATGPALEPPIAVDSLAVILSVVKLEDGTVKDPLEVRSVGMVYVVDAPAGPDAETEPCADDE